MKVLITGSDGYIGSVLLNRLKFKHQVTPYDILRQQDIRNEKQLIKACKGQDAVIHLAGMVNNDWCVKHPVQALDVNENAIHNVIKACENVKRLIFASSVAAYGSSNEPFNEAQELKPATPYGKAKAYCERELAKTDLPWVVTRSASVCGWSLRMRWDLTVNQMVHDAMEMKFVHVNGGDQMRCHVYIQDLCDFYELLLEAPNELVECQAFNVVEKNESVKETANMVAFVVGGVEVVWGPPTDDRSYMVSGKKAEAVLGWKPKRPYTDAILEMADG